MKACSANVRLRLSHGGRAGVQGSGSVAAHQRDQALAVDRLARIIVTARVEAFLAVVVHSVGSQGNERFNDDWSMV